MRTLYKEMRADLLKVAGVDRSTSMHEVCFDEYVPLAVRSHAPPLGAGVLRLGDGSQTLLELGGQPYSQRLMKVTLVSLVGLDAWPAVDVKNSYVGSPILGTDFTDYEVIDLGIAFRVAIGDEAIIIFWDELASSDAYSCGRVTYLVSKGYLAGIWCTDLTPKEFELFHIASEFGEGA